SAPQTARQRWKHRASWPLNATAPAPIARRLTGRRGDVIGLRRFLCQGTCTTLHRMALRNLITDVAGVAVGHADDAKLASGVTAIVFDEPAVASIDVRG